MAEDLAELAEQMKFEVPRWVGMIAAATGIMGLQYRIEQERKRRADPYFQNPLADLQSIVTSTTFEGSVAFILFLNCASIGFQASTTDASLDGFFNISEHLFIAFFFGEWCLRMLVHGWVWVFELNNFLDSLLIFLTGVLPKWLMEPLGYDNSVLRTFTILRVLRLARVARAVRLIPGFRELWILINGLTTSVRPMIWTIVMLVMILYLFGVVGTELIGHNPVFRDNEHVQDYFGNTIKSMLTLFQLMTLDTWMEDIARPVVDQQFNLVIFFVLFINLGVFVFWNLITAIIVENAFNLEKKDAAGVAKQAELNKKRELKKLAALFLEMDTDGSGELTEDEFFASLGNKKVANLLAILEIKPEDLEQVWQVLDDGDGVLTIKEFANGVRRMKGDAMAKDVVDAQKWVKHLTKSALDLKAQATKYSDSLNDLGSEVERINDDTSQVLGLFHEMYHRLCTHLDILDKEDRDRFAEKEQAELMASLAPKKSTAAQANNDSEEDDEKDDEEPPT